MWPRVSISWGSPPFLYRAFQEEKYARLMLEEGKFRLRHIRHFAVCEDARTGDHQEGMVGWYRLSKEQHAGGGWAMSPYPVYILSLSGPDACLDDIRNRYGRHVVRIGDPERFFFQICKDLHQSFRIDCVRIEYAEPYETNEPADMEERLRMSYQRKRRGFLSDNEYRVAVISTEMGGGYLGLDFNLGCALECAELL